MHIKKVFGDVDGPGKNKSKLSDHEVDVLFNQIGSEVPEGFQDLRNPGFNGAPHVLGQDASASMRLAALEGAGDGARQTVPARLPGKKMERSVSPAKVKEQKEHRAAKSCAFGDAWPPRA